MWNLHGGSKTRDSNLNQLLRLCELIEWVGGPCYNGFRRENVAGYLLQKRDFPGSYARRTH